MLQPKSLGGVVFYRRSPDARDRGHPQLGLEISPGPGPPANTGLKFTRRGFKAQSFPWALIKALQEVRQGSVTQESDGNRELVISDAS